MKILGIAVLVFGFAFGLWAVMRIAKGGIQESEEGKLFLKMFAAMAAVVTGMVMAFA